MAADWPESKKLELRALWSLTPSLSTSVIGRELGYSKNAVVGKAHRMGLPPRPSPIIRDGKNPQRTYVERMIKARHRSTVTLEPLTPMAEAVLALVAAAVPTPAPAPAIKLRECMWPISDGRPWRFCERTFESDSPRACYCEEHAARSRGHGTPSERNAHDVDRLSRRIFG